MRTQHAGLTPLPVGYEQFHRRSFVNYQLNRAHALGFAAASELRSAGARIRTRDDCVDVFESLAARAARERRLRNATSYLRLAEFFTRPRSPDKQLRYRAFRDLFDGAIDGTGVVRYEVPYDTASLPVYRLVPLVGAARGAVLLHGGFDSVIEEFFAIWERLAAAGYDVYAFDGPGQGGARALAGLTFDHDWEKPVGSILDHFAIASCALVGMSMGGYWAIRAASREPRIATVVAWPPVFDWLERVPSALRRPARSMLRRRAFMRWSVRARARIVPTLRQVVDQVLYMIDGDDPVQVVDWFLAMNPGHLGSEHVTQDVLLLCGEHDTFQPPAMTRAQADALVRARSVTVRTFVASETADQHCQIGNLGLACEVLTTWLWEHGRDRS